MSLTALTAPNGGLAHALANTLQTLDGDPTDAVVVTSDLQRAHETAVAIATRFDLPLLTDPRLREMHFGHWDGRNWHELEITEGAALREWMAQWTRHAPPGGETVADLVARMESALEAFGTLPCDTAVVVSHAGWIRAALCKLRGIPYTQMFDIPVDHLSVTVFELERPGGVEAGIRLP